MLFLQYRAWRLRWRELWPVKVFFEGVDDKIMNVFVLGGKKRHAVERVDQAGGKCLQQVSLFIRLLLDRSHRQLKVYRLHAVNVHCL